MQWLQALVDELITKHPDGEILVSSGASPSGTYHVGHLREIITCDAILLELRRRGRQARHVHFADDLDGLRKIPGNIPAEYEKYLGKPLCDIPAPDGTDRSYADYFLDDFIASAQALGIEMEVVYSHQKYRQGFFVPAIERCLEHMAAAKQTLETVAGRQLDEHWSPIQIMEDGYLKNRPFLSIDTKAKTLSYQDKEGKTQTVAYDKGAVKLDWRLDWPGRWWLLGVNAEPFGRDHATKGGSFDTGVGMMEQIYKADPPIPVPYDFVNLAGDNKKMSASRGTGIQATEIIKVLPAEVTRFFMLRYAPAKRLYFDQTDGTIKLVDEYAALSSQPELSESDQQLLYVCSRGSQEKTVSRVPFSHLVASYQAALKDAEKTLQILGRTEYSQVVKEDRDIIIRELAFIHEWLKLWAPEDVKFEPLQTLEVASLSVAQKTYLQQLGQKVADAPQDADGAWFHQAIYEFKDQTDLAPKELFTTLYQVLIGKDSGPRAGWFLSMLPRDWLVKRLKLEA
ncbi:MAG: Lysine--tRNA ligase [Patescibacteria group bacterium]|nr:Lysine--tRNA ligase [Patescibacteria group bacterium]